MNKKLKKMLAAVSAVAMCAVSVVSVNVGALYVPTNEKLTPYTVSFESAGVKYNLWQEATDVLGDEDIKIYITEEPYIDEETGEKDYGLLAVCHDVYYRPATDEWIDTCEALLTNLCGYDLSEDNADMFENYLINNNIKYSKSKELDNTNNEVYYYFGLAGDEYERMHYAYDIKKNFGFSPVMPLAEIAVSVTDVVNEIEPTLSGDADCDSKVNINDAVFVMQSIANPDKYQLSWQGKANADIDGNGITLSDAVTIQEMAASHLYG